MGLSRSYKQDYGTHSSNGLISLLQDSKDSNIETVANYAAMLAFGATEDTTFIVLDASDDPNFSFPSGTVAEYSFDSATGNYVLTWASVVGARICDQDGDTCVEVERTADDDTIRFKAANVDMMTATSTNYDIFTVDFNSTRGDFVLFNDATGLFGLNSTGNGYTTAGINVYQYVTNNAGGEASLVHFDSNPGGSTQLIRANDDVALVSAAAPTTINSLECDSANNETRLNASAGTNTVQIIQTPTTIDVEVNSGNLFLNEGTTGSGTGTANPGDVLTLVDAATGEVQYQPTGSTNAFQATLVGPGGAITIFNNADPVGTFYTMAFDTVTNASPDFTLGGGGVITANTTRDYAITYDLTLNCILNGTVYAMGQGLFVNGVLAIESISRSSHNDDLISQNTSKTTILSLTAGDTVELRLQKLVQIGNRVSLSVPYQQTIYIQPA